MLFKYEKFFLGQNQSTNLWPSTDAIGCGLRPVVPTGHGPKESYPLNILIIFLSPKRPLLNM